MLSATIAACFVLASCAGGQFLGQMEQAQLVTPLATSSIGDAPSAPAPVPGVAPPARASAPNPLSTLEQRMQLFRDGALRGFALSALSDDGVEPYTETDFKDLAATGANVVRLPIQLRKCKGCVSYEEPEQGIRYAERILSRGERYGFRVVIVLHPIPGFKESDYWESASLKADIVRNWGLIARRLKGFAALQAYDLINEPVEPGAIRDSGIAHWHSLATAIAREVRAVDPNTPVIVEPMPWGLPTSYWRQEPLDMPGVVYGLHLYQPHEFTHQRLPGYPDPIAYPGNGWDKLRLAQVMDEARRFAAKHKVPMFIGEFSCVRWAPAGSCQRYLADAISLFEAEGWGWAYHCWRCYQGWDAEVPENIPKEQSAGLLPEYRQADSPSLLLLKKSMESNHSGTPN
jgi:endoglucanase